MIVLISGIFATLFTCLIIVWTRQLMACFLFNWQYILLEMQLLMVRAMIL